MSRRSELRRKLNAPLGLEDVIAGMSKALGIDVVLVQSEGDIEKKGSPEISKMGYGPKVEPETLTPASSRQCVVCGKWFLNLGAHMRAHKKE